MSTTSGNNRGSAARRMRRLCPWPSLALAGVALVAGPDAGAQTIDLVDHNGFEQCWSKALSSDGFLQLLASATEGADACLPAAPDGSVCAGSMCTDGSPGCAVTLRAGQYSVGPIDLAAGIARFNASSGFDPFSMPIVLPLVGACTANFVSTANVVVQYPLFYSLAADGNTGFYAYDLVLGTSSVTGLTGDDVTVTGSLSCQVANFGISYFISALQGELQQAIPATIAPATVGQSLCPLQ